MGFEGGGKGQVASDAKSEERFLTAQPDHFTGVKWEENASGCSLRNDSGGARNCGEAARGVTVLLASEIMGPFAGGVEDAEDFEGVCADAVGDDVGSVGDDEFAGAGDSTGAADGGIFA